MNRPVGLQPRDRLIVALDLPSLSDAEALIDKLGDAVGFYKIGYQLAFAHGLPLASALVGVGKRVFLDMKLHDIGVDGIVCSAEEASPLRLIVGPDMTLVTPGIRPSGSTLGDQKRVATPARAIAAGVDYVVVGRPIVEADDPRAVARSIIAEIAQVPRFRSS